MNTEDTPPLFEIRSSAIAGKGAFALRPVRRGTRLIEYVGERISHEEADRRYDDDRGVASHVVLFTVDRHTVVDAGVGGNDARFFNHSCAPNCEAEIEGGHVYLDVIRDIAVGEELAYDYSLSRDSDDPAEEARFPCRCGAPNCRGTLLEPLKPPVKAPVKVAKVVAVKPARRPAPPRGKKSRPRKTVRATVRSRKRPATRKSASKTATRNAPKTARKRKR